MIHPCADDDLVTSCHVFDLHIFEPAVLRDQFTIMHVDLAEQQRSYISIALGDAFIELWIDGES